jgi:hypothetical protein
MTIKNKSDVEIKNKKIYHTLDLNDLLRRSNEQKSDIIHR